MDEYRTIPDALTASCESLSERYPFWDQPPIPLRIRGADPISTFSHISQSLWRSRIPYSCRSEGSISWSWVNRWRHLWSSTFRYILSRERWRIGIFEEELSLSCFFFACNRSMSNCRRSSPFCYYPPSHARIEGRNCLIQGFWQSNPPEFSLMPESIEYSREYRP